MMQRQLMAFEIDNRLFGLDILLVKEINRQLGLTPVYGTAGFVVGTANLRGQVITILDIGQRFDLKPRSLEGESRIIVVKTERELRPLHRSGQLDDHSVSDMVGLMVDRIGDVIQIEPSAIKPVPANFDPAQSRFARGVLMLEDRLMTVLRLESLLSLQSEGHVNQSTPERA